MALLFLEVFHGTGAGCRGNKVIVMLVDSSLARLIF